MNILLKISGLIVGIVLVLNLSAFAQKGLGDTRGISRTNIQPEIENIEGILDQVKTGPCEHTTGKAITGTHLFIDTGELDQLINVHLGAAYAVESYVNELKPGQFVEIQAFRTEKMKPYEFIAKAITTNGKTLHLRDENLRPFWAGDQKGRQQYK